MTQALGLLRRAASGALSAYRRVVRLLESLIPIFDLSVRLYLAHIFWKGGMVKVSSWMSTVMLFTMVYDVPVLPPELAAYLATAVELGGSFLLAIGLAGRWAALALFRAQYRGVALLWTVVRGRATRIVLLGDFLPVLRSAWTGTPLGRRPVALPVSTKAIAKHC